MINQFHFCIDFIFSLKLKLKWKIGIQGSCIKYGIVFLRNFVCNQIFTYLSYSLTCLMYLFLYFNVIVEHFFVQEL